MIAHEIERGLNKILKISIFCHGVSPESESLLSCDAISVVTLNKNLDPICIPKNLLNSPIWIVLINY